MAENVGIRDGQIRTALGVFALFGTGILVAVVHAAPWSLVALLAAIVLLMSGTLRFCPLYSLAGIRTCKRSIESAGSTRSPPPTFPNERTNR